MNNNFKQSRNKPKSINFEEYAADGNHFINQVADYLNTDRDRAARITRAVLHAVRDRLPADDAIEFAQGLPMALKGVFIDRYDPSKTPVIIRNQRKFIDYIRYKAGRTAPIDFPDPDSVVEGLQAVFRVLEQNMSYGQVEQIKHLMNIELVNLIEGDY